MGGYREMLAGGVCVNMCKAQIYIEGYLKNHTELGGGGVIP